MIPLIHSNCCPTQFPAITVLQNMVVGYSHMVCQICSGSGSIVTIFQLSQSMGALVGTFLFWGERDAASELLVPLDFSPTQVQLVDPPLLPCTQLRLLLLLHPDLLLHVSTGLLLLVITLLRSSPVPRPLFLQCISRDLDTELPEQRHENQTTLPLRMPATE